MVARGDLGVELELERVPFAQKLLIRKAKASQVPAVRYAEWCRSFDLHSGPIAARMPGFLSSTLRRWSRACDLSERSV